MAWKLAVEAYLHRRFTTRNRIAATRPSRTGSEMPAPVRRSPARCDSGSEIQDDPLLRVRATHPLLSNHPEPGPGTAIGCRRIEVPALEVAIAWPGVGPGHVAGCFMCLSSRVWPSIPAPRAARRSRDCRTSRRTGHRLLRARREEHVTDPPRLLELVEQPVGEVHRTGTPTPCEPSRIDLFFEMLCEELVEEPVVAEDEAEVVDLDVDPPSSQTDSGSRSGCCRSARPAGCTDSG